MVLIIAHINACVFLVLIGYINIYNFCCCSCFVCSLFFVKIHVCLLIVKFLILHTHSCIWSVNVMICEHSFSPSSNDINFSKIELIATWNAWVFPSSVVCSLILSLSLFTPSVPCLYSGETSVVSPTLGVPSVFSGIRMVFDAV